MAAGLQAGGPHRGSQLGHRQLAVTSQRGHTRTEGRDWGKGPIGCTREGVRGDKGCQAGRQTDRGSQANRQVASQADTQRDRQTDSQKGRQTDKRPCGWQSLPGRSRQTVGPRARGSLGREAPVGLSECGCHPCPAGRVCRVGGRGGCGEQLPAGPAHRATGPSLGE